MVTLSMSDKVDASRIISNVIVVNTNKPEFGSIMFTEDHIQFGTGFVNAQKRVHFESGKIADLQKLVTSLNLKLDSKLNNFKIVVKESTIPSYEGQTPKINPSNAEVMKSNGQDIYRTTLLAPITSTEEDVLLKNDAVVVPTTAKTDLSKTELDLKVK